MIAAPQAPNNPLSFIWKVSITRLYMLLISSDGLWPLFCLAASCREGLIWVDINWMDNGECLDLIEKVRGWEKIQGRKEQKQMWRWRQWGSEQPRWPWYQSRCCRWRWSPSVSIETGSPGTDEWGESLPQSYRRHVTGEAPQPALSTSPIDIFLTKEVNFFSLRLKLKSLLATDLSTLWIHISHSSSDISTNIIRNEWNHINFTLIWTE